MVQFRLFEALMITVKTRANADQRHKSQAHYEAAKKTEKDPDGGSWPAYPSGKSWDEATAQCEQC